MDGALVGTIIGYESLLEPVGTYNGIHYYMGSIFLKYFFLGCLFLNLFNFIYNFFVLPIEHGT